MKDFEDYNIESGEQYANILIENLRGEHDTFEELPENLMLYWEEGIMKKCIERYDDYIKGRSDDYRLYESDMIDTYTEASLKATQDIVADLVDKGEIQMAINDKGEIVYGSNNWDVIKERETKRKKN